MLAVRNIGLIENELAIVWSDGEESYIHGERLRRACPCASCQGEPDAAGRVVRPKVTYTDRSFTLSGYELVGGYALLIRFEDGHATGIYPFNYVREISSQTGEGS